MRLIYRLVLLTLLAVSGSGSLLFADHLVADCPLTFVGASAAASDFGLGPHGVFQNGSVVYVLRGNTLTTFNITDVGDVQLARPEDPIPTMGTEVLGGSAFNNGFLFVSTETGLEVYDLRTTRGGAGGTGPIFVTRVPNVHYRRLTATGNLLAAMFPISDIPCSPAFTAGCGNVIDIYSVSNPAAPVRVGLIDTRNTIFRGFDDIQFANGFLYATGETGTFAFSLANPASPALVASTPLGGKFLAHNGSNFLAVGHDSMIAVTSLGPGAIITPVVGLNLPSIMDRQNRLRFHPDAFFDGARVITMIDEVDPLDQSIPGYFGKSARTIAFDVFDLTVPLFEGFDDRIYENVTYTWPDEVKHDAFVVGPYVYTIGEISGVQKWGACGQLAGQIEFENIQALSCGGTELRGWVTGASRVTAVEVYLDNTLIGNATLGRPRPDIQAPNGAVAWRVSVNMDQTTAGLHHLRAIGTDLQGNRRQFASVPVQFPGAPFNCVGRRRITKR